MDEESINENLRRGGEYFILSIWIQSQMTDLIVFCDHPRIIKSFMERPEKIPTTLRNERMKYWQKDFGFVRTEFLKRFRDQLSEQAISDLDTIYGIRNAIGHSYVSLARNYFLYRPGSRKKLNEYRKAFVTRSKVDAAKPTLFKFDFSNDEIYFHNFSAIQRMDEIHLKNTADVLGIKHSRIR